MLVSILHLVCAFGLAAADEPARALTAAFDGARGGLDAAAFAPAAVPPVPGTRWVAADPGGAASDGNSSAPEKLSFWAALQRQAFDQVCMQAQIPASIDHRFGSIAKPGTDILRYLRRLPDGQLAIIDEDSLRLDLGWLPRADSDFGNFHLAGELDLGATVTGTSMVIRRLPSNVPCDALKRIPNLKDIKLVVPVRADRIAGMAVGEIWRLPLNLRVGVGGTAGDAVQFPLTVSLGAKKEGDVTATLRRLDENTLRFRLRLESARILDAEGNVSANIPVLVFGLPTFPIAVLTEIGRSVSRGLAEALQEYLAVQLDLQAHRADGRQAVFEFLLDPHDAASMERLARLIRGDLSALTLLKRTTGLRSAAADDPFERLEPSLGEQESALGARAEAAGVNDYHLRERSVHMSVPFLWQFSRGSSNESDDVTVVRGDKGEYHLFRNEATARRAFLDIPILGQVFTRSTQKDAEIVVRKEADGTASGPELVYVQQEGFLRQDRSDAQGMVSRANDLATLVGVHGDGRNAATALSAESMVPSPAASGFWHEGDYRRGASALTLSFSTGAIAGMLSAGPAAVLDAYANALDGAQRVAADWLVAHATVSASGVGLGFMQAARAARALAAESGASPFALFRALRAGASTVSALVKGLADAAQAPTPEARAQTLSDLLSGKEKRGLSYSGVLRVLIQFVDPAQMSAEYFLDLVQGKRGRETRTRYVMNDGPDGGLQDAATKARELFQAPSPLSD